jgi:hypothetical protein
MPTDWLLRIGDGGNFWRSSSKSIWGFNSHTSHGKHFMANVKDSDKLWFVKGDSSGGLLVAVANFKCLNDRQRGPLIHVSYTNEELGWYNEGDIKWDTEIHYTNLFDITTLDLRSYIKGASTIRKYNEKCLVNLATEYLLIERYSRVIPKY